MRLETASSYSTSIASLAKIFDASDGGRKHKDLIKGQGKRSPIFQKHSTNFCSMSLSKQITAHDSPGQSVNATNSNSIDCEHHNTVFMKEDNVTDHGMAKVSSIITSPPETSKMITAESSPSLPKRSAPGRLNKFVRRLHEMLLLEQSSGIVEWRKGLLVLHSTDAFTKKFLPKYFGTKNFKTFRRQLNYYGFVHVRSFSATGSTTTALWVNQDLAKRGTNSIASVLMLKRVEPSESSKTAEGRRVRKEEAASTVEDIGINTRTIQLEQIRNLAAQGLQKEEKEDEQVKVIKIDSDLIVPITSAQNCQESQAGTESTTSNTSSRESSTASSPVPSSINVTYPCTNSGHSPSICISSDVEKTSFPSNMDCTHQPIVSVSDTSTDDAANLLMMFSRSTFQKKSYWG